MRTDILKIFKQKLDIDDDIKKIDSLLHVDEKVLQKLEFGQSFSLLAQKKEVSRLHAKITRRHTFYNDFDARQVARHSQRDRRQYRQEAAALLGRKNSSDPGRRAVSACSPTSKYLGHRRAHGALDVAELVQEEDYASHEGGRQGTA